MLVSKIMTKEMTIKELAVLYGLSDYGRKKVVPSRLILPGIIFVRTISPNWYCA
ncbi:MAG: hypothetical protein ACQEWV_16750 [Bacillota bacterium]